MQKYLSLILIFFIVLMFVSCKHTTNTTSEKLDITSEDTLDYDIFTLDTSDLSCKSKFKNCPSAKIRYAIFTTKDTSLDDFLNHEIKDGVLLKGDSTKFSTVYDFVNDYFEGSRKMKFADDYDDESSKWEIERNAEPLARIGNYITLQFYDYMYEGGAHPNAYTVFKTYDITQKRQLKLEELLNVNDTSLLSIGEHHFRKKNEVPDSLSLADVAFFIFGDGEDFEDSKAYGKFHFNDNFAFTKDGIEFFYNTYEIGPYAVGTASFTIPYEQVIPYLKIKIW